MAAASNYLENALLNYILRDEAYTAPTQVYVGLFKNDSGSAASNLEDGVITDEVSSGGYARQPITFSPAASGSTSNDSDILFPITTSSWGTITHVAVMDELTDGNVLFWGEVTDPKTISVGDLFLIATDNLSITLD